MEYKKSTISISVGYIVVVLIKGLRPLYLARANFGTDFVTNLDYHSAFICSSHDDAIRIISLYKNQHKRIKYNNKVYNYVTEIRKVFYKNVIVMDYLRTSRGSKFHQFTKIPSYVFAEKL